MLLTDIDKFLYVKKAEQSFVIITYNNPWYLKNTINQLEVLGVKDIIVIDSNSTYEPMLDLLHELSSQFLVLKKDYNNGPRDIFIRDAIFLALPNIFYVTDPDLQGFDKLPKNFEEVFRELCERQNLAKVGSALKLEMEEENILGIQGVYIHAGTIGQWEEQWYKNKLCNTIDSQPVYQAPIDTTFCRHDKNKMLINGYGLSSSWHLQQPTARVGGTYALEHLPWRKRVPIPKEEYEYYRNSLPDDRSYGHSVSTTQYFRDTYLPQN